MLVPLALALSGALPSALLGLVLLAGQQRKIFEKAGHVRRSSKSNRIKVGQLQLSIIVALLLRPFQAGQVDGAYVDVRAPLNAIALPCCCSSPGSVGAGKGRACQRCA